MENGVGIEEDTTKGFSAVTDGTLTASMRSLGSLQNNVYDRIGPFYLSLLFPPSHRYGPCYVDANFC